MTSTDPDQPPRPPDAYAPVDYPPDAGLPPPLYPPPAPGYQPPPPGYVAGPAPYPGYDPYDPYRPMRPPGMNGMAIASLAVSVGSIVLCCGATAFIGIILGVIGMRQTRRTGQDGHGLALAGTIVGGLATAGWVIYLLFYVALMASGWQWI